MEIDKELRRAVDTGKVVFGTEQVLKDLRDRKAKLILVASNAPALEKRKLEAFAKETEIQVIQSWFTNNQLGSLCGKPFGIAALSVRDEGKSKILETQ